MKYHFLPAPIPYGDRSIAYWSKESMGDMLIFVHGFGFGRNPETAWRDFPRIMTNAPQYAGHDILFFSYRGTPNNPPIAHSNELYRLLEDVFSDRRDPLTPRVADIRPELRTSSVCLIGHSLGAIVSRMALLRAFEKEKDWRRFVQLAFFAPAHRGARVVRAYGALVSTASFIPLAEATATHFLVLPELLNQGSDYLTSLETRVATMQSRNDGSPLIPHFNLFGSKDKIVVIEDFAHDQHLDTVLGKNHISICKPREDYMLPVDRVGSAL